MSTKLRTRYKLCKGCGGTYVIRTYSPCLDGINEHVFVNCRECGNQRVIYKRKKRITVQNADDAI